MKECISPITIKHPHTQTGYVGLSVPCGECIPCMQRRRAGWTYRIREEMRSSKSAHFITLTYDQENLPMMDKQRNIRRLGELAELLDIEEIESWNNPTLKKDDLQKFIRAIRDRQRRENISPIIRYYGVGEYGNLGRPHYHIIVFNLPLSYESDIKSFWKKGQTKIDIANEARSHYVTGYMLKGDKDYERCIPKFSMMSLKPSIGHTYINRMSEYHQSNNQERLVDRQGNKLPMPRYYKRKIFTEKEREEFNKKREEFFQKRFNKENEEREKGTNPANKRNDAYTHMNHEFYKQRKNRKL